MRWLSAWRVRLQSLFRRDRLEDDMDRELRLHLEQQEDEHVASGLSPAEARRRARLAFGQLDVVKDDCRQAWGLRVFDVLTRDLRYGARTLRKAPGFAAVAILTLALGIGATAAIFSVVNGVLLKPLPYEDPDELVGVWYRTGTSISIPMTPAQYFTYRDENRVFDDIGFYTPGQVSVTGLEEPEQLYAMSLTAGLLPLLRVRPVIGRRFTEEDDSPGAPQTIMLSHAYWQRQFGADPAALGNTLRVDGTPREIIGVVPSAFVPPPGYGGNLWEAAIYIPHQWDRVVSVRDANNHLGIARLLTGATIE